jgi:hypothetical protein
MEASPRRNTVALCAGLLVAGFVGLADAAPAWVTTEQEIDVDVNVDVDVQVMVRSSSATAPTLASPHTAAAEPLRGDRWELVLRGIFGPRQAVVADASGVGGGVDLALGRQLGSLRLAVEAGYSKFSLTRDTWNRHGGEMVRVGAAARVRGMGAPDTSYDTPMQLAAYAEVVGGWHRLRWTNGYELTRPELGLGAGFEIAGGRRSIGGGEFGVRLSISESVAEGPSCAAACRAATADWLPDIAVLFHFGAIYGR